MLLLPCQSAAALQQTKNNLHTLHNTNKFIRRPQRQPGRKTPLHSLTATSRDVTKHFVEVYPANTAAFLTPFLQTKPPDDYQQSTANTSLLTKNTPASISKLQLAIYSNVTANRIPQRSSTVVPQTADGGWMKERRNALPPIHLSSAASFTILGVSRGGDHPVSYNSPANRTHTYTNTHTPCKAALLQDTHTPVINRAEKKRGREREHGGSQR